MGNLNYIMLMLKAMLATTCKIKREMTVNTAYHLVHSVSVT